MRRFSYRATEQKTGKHIKGSIQAESERAAGKLLIDRGYIPDSFKEEGSGLASKLNKVTTKDKLLFTRQFATLIGAGLPLANSLRTVSEQTQNKSMRAIIEEILADVEAGKSLGDAFAKHPDVFDKVYLSLVRAGEVSGTLDDSLRRIAAQQEKDAAMMSKIRGAMTYPAIVLVVIIAVVIFMMVTVVPQVENLYDDLGEELPALTAFMVAMSAFAAQFWWLMIIVMAGLVWGFLQFRKTKTGISFFATFKLNVPIFKGLFQRLYMARFARTAQILLATGVPMLDTLKISGDAMNNVTVQKSVDEAAERVQAGKQLSDSLKGKDYILPLIPQMASIGEQSGKIDEMLGKAAQVYEDELDEQIKAISTMIEPILMVFLAVVAGGMVGAILFPIYSLVNNI
ncbi:MAG: type II secretion system F family protein [Candidatus Nomurabacteria bacterium]|jgi:type IV pilus assembly protein PilC|nr:type II secretion system F family protein [Candidatus Nomurabacteria bacterium]